MRRNNFFAISCLFFLLVSISCKEEQKISSNLFNTANLKVKINSVYDLKDQGFIPEEGNISILSKRDKDTIVKLEVNFDFNCLESKTWKIKFNSFDRGDVDTFLRKHDVYLIGPAAYYDDNCYQVLSVNFETNKLFICSVSKEEEEIYLEVKYYIPR